MDAYCVPVAMVLTEDELFKFILDLDRRESFFTGLKMVRKTGLFLDRMSACL